MLKIIRHFWRFIINPSDRKLHPLNGDTYGKIFFCLLFLKFIVLAIVFPIQYLIEYLNPTFTLKGEAEEDILFYIFMIAILSPLIESFVFHYFLKYKRYYKNVIVQNTWRKKYNWIVYSSVLLFGAAHLTNYENTQLSFYLLGVLIVLVNIIDGFVLTFIRVRLGFVYSWILYGLWNVIVLAITSTITVLNNPVIQIDNPVINLQVNSTLFRDTSKMIFFIRESDEKIYNLNINQYPLSKVIDSIYGKNNYQVKDQFIDLEMRSVKGLRKDSLLDLLRKDFTIEPK